jgi:hypothetical protein
MEAREPSTALRINPRHADEVVTSDVHFHLASERRLHKSLAKVVSMYENAAELAGVPTR